MNSFRRSPLLIALTVFALACGAIFWWNNYQTKTDYERTEFETSYADSQPLGNQVLLIRGAKASKKEGDYLSYNQFLYPLVSSTKIANLSYNLTEGFNEFTAQYGAIKPAYVGGEYASLEIKEWKSSEKETIDLLKALKKYRQDAVLREISPSFVAVGDKTYLTLSIFYPKESSIIPNWFRKVELKDLVVKDVLFDVESQKIEEMPQKEVNPFPQAAVFRATNLADFYNDKRESGDSIYFTTNKRIYVKTAYFIDTVYARKHLLKHDPQDSDWMQLAYFSEAGIAQLIEELKLEGGPDLMKGVTLSAAYSKDGQDHVLESYEDFKANYKGDYEFK